MGLNISEISDFLKENKMKGEVNLASKRIVLIKGPVDFIGNYNEGMNSDPPDYMEINLEWIEENFSGKAKEILLELRKYVNDEGFKLFVGSEEKPYQVIKGL